MRRSGDRAALRRLLGDVEIKPLGARFYAICTALEDLDYGVPLYRENAQAALEALR